MACTTMIKYTLKLEIANYRAPITTMAAMDPHGTLICISRKTLTTPNLFPIPTGPHMSLMIMVVVKTVSKCMPAVNGTIYTVIRGETPKDLTFANRLSRPPSPSLLLPLSTKILELFLEISPSLTP